MLRSLLSVFAAMSMLAVAQAQNNKFPDCTKQPLVGTPVCDPKLPYNTRATWIVSQMNLTEKASRLQNTSPAVARLGLPAYEWWSEALHGVAGSPGVSFQRNGTFRCATSFPEPIGIASAFDRQLVQTIAGVTSDEARAFNNAGFAGMDYWTPNCNIFRDPRWGRGQETPGEDTYLSSEYTYYLIHGYQVGEDARYYKVVADCKHYAGYDVEHWHGIDRYSYDAIINNQDLIETYLPSFKSCLKDAQVGSAMCSYNAVNGVPACANDLFMNQIARGRWGWKGWITSDCGAVSGIYDGHHYVSNHSDQVKVSLRAGCDIGCDSAFAQYAAQAVNDGTIMNSDLDKALVRQFESLIRLGYFDDAADQPYRHYGEDKVHNDAATALSHKAAQEGLVLLKNDGTLPLDAKKVMSIAVIGPNARNPGKQIGNYAGEACFMHTPVDGFTGLGVKVTYAMGCAINSTDTSGFDAALNAAKAADAVVFVGGIDNSIEAEGLDREGIEFPGQQGPLVTQLAALGKPFILVLYGGGGTDVSAFDASSGVNAIIWHGYPSQSGGDALAEAVFGVFSPAGRLPVTWYPKEYTNQLQLTDQSMRPSSQSGAPGRTYKFYTGKPVYAFGQGLSYTTFRYDVISAPAKTMMISDLIDEARLDDRTSIAASMTLNVTNTGKVTSDVTVLGYVSSTSTFNDVTPPIKELFDYQRLYQLAPGASTQVILGLSYRVFSSIDQEGHAWLLPGEYKMFVHDEKMGIAASTTFTMVGEPLLVEDSPVSKVAPRTPVVQGLPTRKSSPIVSSA